MSDRERCPRKTVFAKTTYTERQMATKTHASSTNFASAVRAAHEVVDDNGGILIISAQLFFDLVEISLIYVQDFDVGSKSEY